VNMPTSDFHNINCILGVAVQLNPLRVLDVGCGFGKYGVLVREYLDVWHERLEPSQWRAELVGIEGCERYRNPIHDYVYSEMHFGDACEIVPTLGEFDLILIADMIEHLEKQDARRLVEECLKRSPVVVISTPVEFHPQREILGNPYEVHRCCWRREDFAPGIWVHTIRLVACNVFVAGRKPLGKDVIALTDPTDYIYLRSRLKLGWLGLPLSLGLRFLCRLLS
jgi:SAM-dependent methyltransferase